MTTDFYFQRFGFCERQIATPPQRGLGIVAVIPCFNEPDLLASLASLWACDRPGCAVEVIVVVNSPAGCGQEILSQNQRTLAMASAWIARHADRHFAFHLLHFPDLPAKQAGVGLARKIGMDEAVRRFDAAGNLNGIIVGYDADCRCAKNYLTAIAHHFQNHPRCPACSIYFEHPLQGPLEPAAYEAVTAYELHLRYYVRALRWAGFPHAYHTIGSCMAVCADAYMQQGGMNKRQAGEDFYFLHKIIPLGGFTELTATVVYPSPRASDRVPFGTGKAVRDYLNREQIRTYPLEAFLDLKALFDRLTPMCQGEKFLDDKRKDGLPASIRTFLDAQGFAAALQEIRENTSSEATFRKRFFLWCNGFQVMKFVHHARDYFYGEREVATEANKLLNLLPTGERFHSGASPRDLLSIYRDLARSPN